MDLASTLGFDPHPVTPEPSLANPRPSTIHQPVLAASTQGYGFTQSDRAPRQVNRSREPASPGIMTALVNIAASAISVQQPRRTENLTRLQIDGISDQALNVQVQNDMAGLLI
ncbi:hypothetical protein V5R04_06685 [Jonesiaceae bacterium BS-20]|uniref:Uncharacterized protein n=1 Tax=Jonesiaceae bacterium BS-20 TaxID=3120821 RepID=A0AAU7DY08_9MICO